MTKKQGEDKLIKICRKQHRTSPWFECMCDDLNKSAREQGYLKK